MPLQRNITYSAARAFTLVELLVVMVIIAVLVAISGVAYSNVIKSAKKTQASAMCAQLVGGLQAYFSEYKQWPVGVASDGNIDSATKLGNLATVLNGGRAINATSPTAAPNADNPRGVHFLSFTKKDYTLGDSTVNYPVTPWDGFYYLKFDTDLDNFLTGLPEKGDSPTGGSLGMGIQTAAWAADTATSDGMVVAISYE